MKLTCIQDNLKKSIQACEKVVAKRNTLPILSNLLLEADKNSLKIEATNLEIGIIAKIGAKVEKTGRIAIPAKLISSFFSNLPSGEKISLEADKEKNLKIESGSNKTIIKSNIADDFPLIPLRKREFVLKIPTIFFKIIFSKVSPAIAINEARQELTGFNLILKEKELFWAATDSFRLSEYKLERKNIEVDETEYLGIVQNGSEIIIPFNVLAEINHIIPTDLNIEDDNKINIAIEEGQIFFEFNEIKVVSRLINGKYPEYKHIIPKKYETKLICDKNILQNGIKLAGLFASGNSNEIRLKIDSQKKNVFLLASGSETGENSTELKYEAQGPSQEVVFNAKYLLDGVLAVSTKEVMILINNDTSPIAIKEVNEKTKEELNDFIYIVMPIKK